MGDTCHMRLTCKRAEKSKFEELGFDEDYDASPPFSGCVEMVDFQANYGHGDDLPYDTVYLGSHDAGDDYAPAEFACDGEIYVEHSTDGHGAFVVLFDDAGNPDGQSLADVKAFIIHRNKTAALLKLKNSTPSRRATRKNGLSKSRQSLT